MPSVIQNPSYLSNILGFVWLLISEPIRFQSEALQSQDQSFQSCRPILAKIFSPFCHCFGDQ
jgi:hypothetical protein